MKRITLLLLFASVLYIPYLGNLITYDEVVTLRYFADSPTHALFLWAAPNNHLLHSLLVWVSTTLMGRSELAIRLPAYFAAMLAIASIYHLGRRMYIAQAGLVAATITACTSSFIVFATTARGYSLGLFLAIQLIGQILFPRKTTYTILLVSMALMMVVPSMAILLAGVGIWTLWKSRRMAAALAVGTLCGSAFYAPSLVLQTIVVDFGIRSPSDLISNFGQLLYPWPLGIVLIVLALVGLTQMHLERQLLWGSIGLVAVLLACAQWEISHRLFYARNYLYALPLLAIPAGIAATRLSYVVRGIIVVGWLLPPIIWGSTQTTISADILSVEPELPRFLEYIDTELTPEDGLVIGCCIDQPAWYYAAGKINQLDPQDKQRFVVVATPHASLEEILEDCNTDAVCTLLEPWQTITLYECFPVEE
ncbi:MAG: glycosyltransferase family 39 protein [Anaerolineae bacterium]|nr:glycosyltransferase family 39 protein [Anaerolineae bacterium]